MQQKKWLVQLFFLSVGLNIVLFALLFLFPMREHFFLRRLSFSFAFPHQIEPLPRGHTACVTLQEYELPQLLHSLQDRTLITPTARVCDLALSILVEKHHFAIEEVLYEKNLEKEKNSSMVTFYSDLEAEDFKKLYLYGKRERYPFSTQGLFLLLKREADPAVAAAFMNREHFQLVKRLFQQQELLLDDKLILELLLQGSWGTVDQFYQRQKETVRFSKGERRLFLKALLHEKAPLAPYVILLLDYQGVIDTFETAALVTMIEMITKQTALTMQFMQAMTEAGRPEVVVQAARRKLSGAVVAQPKKEEKVAPQSAKAKASSSEKYTVQVGDSLWVIAKRFQISIEELKELNRLKNDTVWTGQKLVVHR